MSLDKIRARVEGYLLEHVEFWGPDCDEAKLCRDLLKACEALAYVEWELRAGRVLKDEGPTHVRIIEVLKEIADEK